jgi:hypothetical protein
MIDLKVWTWVIGGIISYVTLTHHTLYWIADVLEWAERKNNPLTLIVGIPVAVFAAPYAVGYIMLSNRLR